MAATNRIVYQMTLHQVLTVLTTLLLHLDRRRRLAGHIVGDASGPVYLVDDTCGHPHEEVHVKLERLGRHEIRRHDRTEDDDIALLSFVSLRHLD